MRRLLPVLVFLCSAPAFAQEEAPPIVRQLAFTGVVAIDDDRLRAVLATRQSSRLPWGDKYPFEQVRFDADLKRIVAFYADRGYPDARVVGFDVNLSEDRESVSIEIRIEEGAPVLVTDIRFVGFEVIPPERADDLVDDAPLEIGDPRDRQLILDTRDFAANQLREYGYPFARVTTSEAEGAATHTTVVTFTAEPGARAVIGPIEYVGNESVSQRVIERQLLFRPGDVYRRSAVQESQRRLYALELFQFVNVETLQSDERPGEVRMRVTIAEGRHQRVNAGVGYGTEEKGRVDGAYRHVNFLGDARAAGIQARWSSLDRGARLEFNQPYFFHRRFAFGGEGQQWYTFTPSYESVITGARLTVTYRAGARTSAALSFLSERSTSSLSSEALADPTLRDELIALGLDPTTNAQAGTLNAIAIDAQRTTADSLLNPTRGYNLGLRAEHAGGVLPGTFSYVSLSADARHYVPVGDRIVIANRLQLATLDEPEEGTETVPFSKRFFLGGATSLRGWGRYEVGPLAGGLPIGGQSLLAFSSELRAAIEGNLGAVLFLDAGNVWRDEWSISTNDLRYSLGLGLRYDTRLGPIRLDGGYQLNPIDDLLVDGNPQRRRYRIHFSIGQAF